MPDTIILDFFPKLCVTCSVPGACSPSVAITRSDQSDHPMETSCLGLAAD